MSHAMETRQLKAAIELLKLELRKKEELVKATQDESKILRSMIDQYSKGLHASDQTSETLLGDGVISRNGTSESTDSDFPIHGRSDNQISYIVQTVGRGMRIPEIQKEYTRLTGSERNIRTIVHRMKDMGLLVLVKYNNVNTQSYYGLPEWLGEKDYKDDYKPPRAMLPAGHLETEIIMKPMD